MSNYSRGEVVLVRYPFSDLSGSKIRPAVIINAPHTSKDVLILPLTSKTRYGGYDYADRYEAIAMVR
jgi:mRNA interferase MazF